MVFKIFLSTHKLYKVKINWKAMVSYDEQTIANFLGVAVSYGQGVRNFDENPNKETASALMINLDSIKRHIPEGIREKYHFLKEEQLDRQRLEGGNFLDTNEKGEYTLILQGTKIRQI